MLWLAPFPHLDAYRSFRDVSLNDLFEQSNVKRIADPNMRIVLIYLPSCSSCNSCRTFSFLALDILWSLSVTVMWAWVRFMSKYVYVSILYMEVQEVGPSSCCDAHVPLFLLLLLSRGPVSFVETLLICSIFTLIVWPPLLSSSELLTCLDRASHFPAAKYRWEYVFSR